PKGKTTYLAPFGKNLAFEGRKGIRILEFTDGTSNTILVLDVNPERAVVWTKPEDLPIDLMKLPAGLGGQHGPGFCVSMCDGSARFFSKDVPDSTLKLLLQRNDGTPIPEF